jgi:hypothetical protein
MKSHLTPVICLAALCCAVIAPLSMAQCERQSPAHTVALVELYTSEGCSSCPPADKWLGTFGATHAPNSAIPLSLHVDYWDYLGWKDRFADARFSARQNDLTRRANGRVVYTPEVFLGLREFREWRSEAEVRQAIERINARPARAEIHLALAPQVGEQMQLSAQFRVKAGSGSAQPQAFVALYENALATEVRAGENQGEQLRHNHVVRQWLGPIAFRDGTATLERTLRIDPEWRRANMGVAAFVQDATSLDMLQATAMKFCG